MITSIDEHKRRLSNRMSFVEREEAMLAKMVKSVDRLKRGAALYSAQIDLAEKEGKAGFDEDRYAIKRLIGL